MEQGYKHFSHSHNLVMHQLPEGVDVSCSGCNSSGNGTVFICWLCNFFLHEQCYRATRSLKHPSHPPHPLTLVPYPTYPSNSFYCNSCEIIGTGLSYSCAHCEFDLHVQCAYSISRATSFQKTHQYPTNYYNPDQNSHNFPFVSVPHNLHHPLTGAQNPYMDPNAHSVSIPNQSINGQYHSTGQDVAYVSIPPVRQHSDSNYALIPSTIQDRHSLSNISGNPPYPITSAPYPSMADSIPTSSQNPVTSPLYPTLDVTSVSIPTNIQNPIANDQKFNMAQNFDSVSIPPVRQNSDIRIPSTIQDGHLHDSIPANPPYPITSAVQTGPSDSIPPVTATQYPSITQPTPYVSIPTRPPNPVTNPSKPQNGPSVSIPTADYQPDNHVESVQNHLNPKGIMHFSHPHSLRMVNIQADEGKEMDCSGCEDTLEGKGFSCVEPNCDFHLHESCFHLKPEIQHKSHPQHPLTLLPLAPYKNENDEFTCNACFSDGTGFTYHCSICKFDLHVQCVNLPETVKRSDHQHMLTLYYSCPVKGEENTFSCDVCHVGVQEDRWAYYCESCDYCTHLGCVDCEECVVDSLLETQAKLQRMQLQLEMSRQNAQLIASIGASMLSLV